MGELRGLRVVDIKHPSGSRVGTSIAVLPFRNMSADPDNEYFSDGLSESIINTLGRVRDLKVVARTSAFSFKGKDADVREIGRQLNAGHVLEGGVQRTGKRLRITAQLIDASDGCQLWSERYDRSVEDIFAIQDEISLAIVGRLDIQPPTTEKARIVRRHTEDPEAYNLYLKGRFLYNKRTEGDLKRSLEHYRAALDRDPDFALPYAGLADSYATLGFSFWMPYEEARQKAKEAAMRGLEIDDTICETHAAYANVILWFYWKFTEAEEKYRIALHLSPSDVEARHMYAHLLESLGRFEEALEEMGKALELEPLSVNLNTCLAQILFFARRYDDAVERLGKTMEMDPGFPLQYFWLGRAYLHKGMFREAVAMFEEGAKHPTIRAIAVAGLGYVRAIEGRADDVRRVLEESRGLAKKGQVSPYFLGILHAGLKDNAAALDHLERAYDEGDMYLFYLKVDPALDDLRDEPRFRDLMVKTGLAGSPAAEATISLSPPRKPVDGPGLREVEGRVGHYRLIEKIGEGGMGVVYKADDTKLRRTVALKFLPPELTRDDAAKARFLREARTAASLDHPHICTVFEINEQGGRTFIAMPFIEGRSLKDRITEEPVGMAEVRDIALQVGEGLKAAHARGIVHRDIKPGNIMLTPDGRAKILDFGLAKLDQGADVTRTMGILGTVAYMSPEQARGEPVDRRTDIWSFGATLYEMLTGQKPFHTRPDHALIHAILNEDPEPMRDMRPNIPREVERIVLKALQKEPTRRYQTMDEMLEDLKGDRPSATIVPESRKSIIVLPFENISPDADQDYFCDGMTEEIITDLSHIHDLLVISRSSAMTFKGTKKTIPEIARAVNVRYFLEGSVRKAGNSLRITAQLIDAETDAHLWAEKYSGTLDDVFDIQERVSRSIADALKKKLTSDEERQLRSRPIPDVRAYDAYLRAYYEVRRFTPDGFNRAFRILDHTLDQVGEYALIHAGLGYFKALAYDFGISHDPGTLVRAERHATRALELDPALGLAYCALGFVRYKQGDLPAYVKLARRAVELDRNTTALWMLAFSLAETGHLAQARQFAEEAVTADPLNIMSGFAQGAVEFFDGRFEEAASCFRRYLEIVGPDEPILLWWLAQALAYQGREDEAVPYFDKVIAADARPLSALSRLWRLAAGGDREGFRKALESDAQLLETARTDEWFPNFIGACLARLGDHAGAIEWLGRAVGWGFSNHRFLGELSPFLAPLRGDSRFQALLEDARRREKALDVSP